MSYTPQSGGLRLTPLPDHFIQNDPRCHGDIQGRDSSLHRQSNNRIAVFADQAAQAAVLASEYERDRNGIVEIRPEPAGSRIQSDNPQTLFLEFIQRGNQ